MNERRANCLLVGWVFLFFLTIAIALFLTLKHRTRPSVFVPPAIWHELFTGGEEPKTFDI